MISHSNTFGFHNEITWEKLNPLLKSAARCLVYSYSCGVSSWRGQEEDIIEDIVQETAQRVIEYAYKAECGEANPIHSLRCMAITVARNDCMDLRRRDCRVLHMLPQDSTLENFPYVDEQPDVLDTASEDAYQELLFMQLADEIARLLNKQRKALLTNLASQPCLDAQLTPLHIISTEGYQSKERQVQSCENYSRQLRGREGYYPPISPGYVENYSRQLLNKSIERSSHAANLNHAYKPIVQFVCVQQHALATEGGT